VPVEKNKLPNTPQIDSMERLKIRLKLPKKRLDLKKMTEAGKITILWSQQLEDEQGERLRQEAAQQARIAEHERLTKLLGTCMPGKKGKTTLFDEI